MSDGDRGGRDGAHGGAGETLDADGHRLEVERSGDPARAPTLVFLHEGLGSCSTWRGFPATVAAAAGASALSYSRWGYGRSEPVTRPRPLSYMHDEAERALPELLARAGLGDVILVGHSDGGSIALIYAGMAGAGMVGAGMVGAGMVEDAVAGAGMVEDATVEAGSRGGAGARLRGLVLLAPHVFVEELGVRSIARVTAEYRAGGPLRARLARHHADVDGAFYGWSDAWLDPDFRRWNIESYLPHIAVPVLAIQGRDDEYGTLSQLDAIARGLRAPFSSLVLDGCGHAPHRDQPERTRDAIAGFVAAARAGAG